MSAANLEARAPAANEAGIAAARQLNRRALDRLYDCGIVAVGSFKVAPSPPHEEKPWICEIHQVVAGAKKGGLGTGVFH